MPSAVCIGLAVLATGLLTPDTGVSRIASGSKA
jgi:hypothetical protein